MPIGPLRLWGFFVAPRLPADAIHAISGGGPSGDATRQPPAELTVLSWNIAYGRDLDRVLGVLRGIDADVLLLQEVDVGCRRSGFVNAAEWLARALGLHWVFAGEFQEIGQGRGGSPALTGQAILSRFPLDASGVIPFSRQARFRWRLNPVQPRRGARMALWAQTAVVRAYNLHVESGKNDAFRREQVDDVILAEHGRACDSVPVIVGGDFNCGPFGHAPLLEVLRRAGFEDPFDTHPATRRTSIRHRHALDWLFVRRLSPLTATIAHHNGASDHFPVVVRVRREEYGPGPTLARGG